MISYSLILVANEVLAHFQELANGSDKFSLEMYSNLREQGYAISHLALIDKGTKAINNKVAFSEHRRTTNIVVYFGTPIDFSPLGNVPREEICKNAQLFPEGEFKKAAQFIFEKLTEKPNTDPST